MTVYALAVIWVLVFSGIALAGLVLIIAYGVWLAHKAADVMGEVAVLADRADELADLVAQIGPPQHEGRPAFNHKDLTVLD